MYVAKASRNLTKVRQSREYLCRLSSKYEGETSTTVPNPNKISSDMVGPADPVSNLRRVVFRHRTNDETLLEKEFREKRMDVQDWNQKFWTTHNISFFQEREEYLKKNLPPDQQTLTADEMSVFYKAFLDKNWRAHVQYNKQWYKNNLQLLMLSIRVKLQRFTGRKTA